MAILTYADEKRLFRGNQENFIDLIQAGEQQGVLVYVVTTQEIKLTGRTVPGYTYNFETETWEKGELRMPHVIYNRIPYRKFELLPEVQQVIQTCMRHGQIRFFNPCFFNKWTLFEWLNKSKSTRAFIPVTQRLTSSADLENMLQQYSTLYLKPVRGKAGLGIMKVSVIADKKLKLNRYQLSIQDKTKSHISRYNDTQELWAQISVLVGARDYIMQQGIALSSYKQRPFDLRVLVQKNSAAQWSIIGIGARLAGKMSITTHVPCGGSIDDPVKLLASAFGEQDSKKILAQVKQAVLLIARQIERASGSNLGEMSMDLGVDTLGQIWFFEANSKPMKFDEPEIRQKSLTNLIQYCIHLSRRTRKPTAGTPPSAVARRKPTIETAQKARQAGDER
ncbi:YheC/YheD family protein [Paenibacillus xerothermodurans]|uniref:YheC/YheD family protein n=1 Tax=Paenibacillus xerothermodurans TaxID=1977292 RepID=A0A2W1NUV2_PAEXE|nr:YheC/YheD family protein [Paenibacillus xerothermodurans]PZE21536.1 YheC/YheD family protein [Paenibacillus xerothermodurans]